MVLLPGKQLVDRAFPAPDAVLAVSQTLLQKSVIQSFPALGLWHRHQVVTPHVAHQSFDPALLVGAVRVAKAGRTITVSPGTWQTLPLDASLAAEDLLYCRGQVIVDQDEVDAAEKGKGMDMPIQEGLLPLTRVAAHKVLPGMLGSQAEKLDRDPLAADNGRRGSPVCFGLLATLRFQRDKGGGHLHSQTPLGLADIAPHRGVMALKAPDREPLEKFVRWIS